MLIVMSLSGSFVFGQQGEIIYTDFEPDSIVHYTVSVGTNRPMSFDLDKDGTVDFTFTCEGMPHFMLSSVLRCDPSWRFRLPYLIYHVDDAVPIEGDTIRIGDTIQNIESSWTHAYRFQYNRYDYEHPYQQTCPDPDSHYYISVRHAVEDGYCYGWIDSHVFISEDPVVNGSFYGQEIIITVFGMAYCTIPNYPLRVGQTSLDTGIDELGATAFANIYPNPTNGQVTIMGKDLKSVEVLNILRQRVATAQGKDKTLQIDLADLPAGVYFVNITDEEGRKCVKKVVKE